MEKRKHMWSDTTVQIFLRNLLLVCVAVILTGGISLYLALTIRQNDMDTAIQNLACIVSQMDIVRESLEAGEALPELKEELDLLINNCDQADVLVVCDKDSIRYYHTEPERVGKKFKGDDQGEILNGADPYISEAEGTLGMQRRAFYPVRGEDDQIIGFVTVSVLTKSLTQIRNNIIRIFILIFGALFSLGALLSGASVYSIRKILLGHDPEEFRKMFLEHTDVIDRLEEGLLAVDTKGNITLINKSARQMLGIEDEKDDQMVESYKNIKDIYPESVLQQVLESHEEVLNHNLVIRENQVLCSDILVRKGEKIEGAVSVFRDKTELTKMAEELTGARYMVDTLRAFNHEFMNKLHIILGFLEMKEYGEARKYILDTSMVSGKEVSHICQTIPVENLAALIIGKLIRAGELGIDFSLKNDSYFHEKKKDLPADCYITLVGNLIENAMDELNSRDFPVKKIEVGIYSEEEHTIITCDDTGGGIPEKILFSIYDRHTTTKGEGHGTGYALIKEIVDSYQGMVHIDTEAGMGSSIEIILPI